MVPARMPNRQSPGSPARKITSPVLIFRGSRLRTKAAIALKSGLVVMMSMNKAVAPTRQYPLYQEELLSLHRSFPEIKSIGVYTGGSEVELVKALCEQLAGQTRRPLVKLKEARTQSTRGRSQHGGESASQCCKSHPVATMPL